MLGTIANTLTILAGGAFGALARGGIGERYKEALFNGLGLCCLVLGAGAALPNMARSECPVLFILSLAAGGILGTRLDLAGRVERLARRGAKSPAALSARERAAQGLTTGCLLYCIGTFSIVGPVLSCLSPSGGWSLSEPGNAYLYTNATLDLVTSAVLSASFGWVMLLAAPVLFCWQGAFYLAAYFLGGAMSEPMRADVSVVGGVLIVSSGLSILGLKDCRTVNLLPSLLVPVVYYGVREALF